MARAPHHPTPDQMTLDGVLHALADPIRRTIVKKLMGGKAMTCGGTCDVTPPSTLSFHYRVLRAAGLVHSAKEGKTVVNTLRQSDINKRFPGLLKTILQYE